MNQGRRAYSLLEEPRGDDYGAILGESLRDCKLASLVQRKGCGFDPEAEAILHELSPALRQEREVSEWPGTRLLKGTALLREYELSEHTRDALVRAVDALYGWSQPARPEDLILWRGEGEPWLVTIAHERDSYFWLTPSEARDLVARLPLLESLLKEDQAR